MTVVYWLLPRVLELTYTAWDLEPFARDCGYDGPPFRWDSARRFLLRCEIDAAFFHLYGLGRDDTAYVLDTFPVVRKRDEAQHGEYRTARVILETYDRMADAARTGVPYVTLLDPPPADPRVAHPARSSVAALAPVLVDEFRVRAYVVLLLNGWARPVRRDVMEASLVLMLNDEARGAILGHILSKKKRERLDGHPITIAGLDGLLGRMSVAGFVTIETVKGHHVIQLGLKAPSIEDAPQADRMRVDESVRAIGIIGEARVRQALEVGELSDANFELVS